MTPQNRIKVVDVYLEDSKGRRRTLMPRPKWWQLGARLTWYFLGEDVDVYGTSVRVRRLP